MQRARAEKLALVNWKGLIYEEFELDPGVTALEGENGAGKTTVMIGAYTVLLPDLTYLRFSNVGESSSGGGEAGIWGRLGQQGPSYAWLDIRMPRQRVIAGVHLHRLSRPRLEVEPFIIEGVAEDVPLEQLIMRKHENKLQVPDPQDLRTLALTHGAALSTFGKNKREYFGRLFELGITPVRMATSDERAKVNEMLKTCMMGGISNTLRTGLRDFLFAENTRLADTVRRMEQNLDLCRTTRAKTARYAEQERQFLELYQAGQETFLYALHGTCRWEAEARDEVERHSRDEQKQAVKEQKAVAELDGVSSALQELEHEREQLVGRLETASRRVKLVQAALELHRLLRDQERALSAATAALEAARSSLERQQANVRGAQDREQRSRDRHTAAAKALGDFQRGFEDLARKVGRYRHARGLLDKIRVSLRAPDLGPERLEASLTAAREELHVLTGRARELQLRLQDHQEHRRRFEQGRALLASLLGRAVEGDDLAETLERADALHRKLERAKDRLPELKVQAARSRKEADLQEQARRDARSLGVDSSAALSSALRSAEATEQDAGAALADAEARLRELEQSEREILAERDALTPTVAPWRDAQAEAVTLSQRHRAVENAADLITLQSELIASAEQAKAALERHRALLDEQKRRRRDLELSGNLPPQVQRARDVVDADLVAEHFDEVSVEDAAVYEAVLGARAHGLLVHDPVEAAEQLAAAGTLEPGQELLLLDSLPTVERSERLDDGSVLVLEHQGQRMARPPAAPVLGRAARERAMAVLEEQIAAGEDQEERQAALHDLLRTDLNLATALLPRAELLDRPDPGLRLRSLRAELQKLTITTSEAQAVRSRASASVEEAVSRSRKLRELLPSARLLDPPDHAAEARELRARLAVTLRDARRLEEQGETWRELSGFHSDLLRPPLAASEVDELQLVFGKNKVERVELNGVIEALEELCSDPEPLGWGHFEPVLAAKAELQPAMQAELDAAEQQLVRASSDAERARILQEEAQGKVNQADADQQIATGRRDETRQKLRETGIESPRPSLLVEARLSLEGLRKRDGEIGEHKSGLVKSEGRIEEQLRTIRAAITEIRTKLATSEQLHEQRQRVWAAFRAAMTEASLDIEALLAQEPGITGSLNLFQAAKGRRDLVASLLQNHDESEEVLELYHAVVEGGSREHVAAWAALRRTLHRRIGPDISEAPDVLQALQDLGRRVHRLRRTLAERERELRTDAKAIGSTIRSQRRRANTKVRELSQALMKVRFGSIKRIELQIKPVRKMNDLLDALAGEVDLFRESQPIEQVLEELFESIGGGKVKASRLLDYRRYFEVKVQVERSDGVQAGARGDQMSTGEAIGVGTAVMMIVLRAWEDHASKLRKKRGFGTMRLLFLDEATRLSRDSLMVMFDLCRKLELQLLIAAPDVDRVEGATIYTLVRSEDGSRVDVHGRRVVARALEG